MSILNQFNETATTVTDKKGFFKFESLDYPDTIEVLLEALTQSNKKNVLIFLIDPDTALMNFNNFKYTEDWMLKRKSIINNYKYAHLKADKNNPYGSGSQIDYAITADKITNSANSLQNVISSYVPGVNTNGSDLSFTRGSGSPLVVIDGVYTNISALDMIHPSDVERIEIIKPGANAAIYGIRGGNGVILVYTKQGAFVVKGRLQFKMLGYHKTKQFYQPKYNISDTLINSEPFYETIYWSPDNNTSKNGKKSLIFNNLAKNTQYIIFVEGITNNGIPFSLQTTYKSEP